MEDKNIKTVVNDQNDPDEEHEELPSDVADAIGIKRKKGSRPPADDYISELENPDLGAEKEL